MQSVVNENEYYPGMFTQEARSKHPLDDPFLTLALQLAEQDIKKEEKQKKTPFQSLGKYDSRLMHSNSIVSGYVVKDSKNRRQSSLSDKVVVKESKNNRLSTPTVERAPSPLTKTPKESVKKSVMFNLMSPTINKIRQDRLSNSLSKPKHAQREPKPFVVSSGHSIERTKTGLTMKSQVDNHYYDRQLNLEKSDERLMKAVSKIRQQQNAPKKKQSTKYDHIGSRYLETPKTLLTKVTELQGKYYESHRSKEAWIQMKLNEYEEELKALSLKDL